VQNHPQNEQKTGSLPSNRDKFLHNPLEQQLTTENRMTLDYPDESQSFAC
jgi:hypothetical protein